jgi:hypothetical protein
MLLHLNLKQGSIKTAMFSEKLAIPSVKMLGIFPSQFNFFRIETRQFGDGETTELDKLKARALTPQFRSESNTYSTDRRFIQMEDFNKLDDDGLIDFIETVLSENVRFDF